MKKTLILGGTLALLTGCVNDEVTLKDDYKIETTEKSECSNDIVEYYKEGNQKLYLVCLDEVKLNDGDYSITLKDYLDKEDKSIKKVTEELIGKLKFYASYDDGGTSLYKSNAEKGNTNNELTLIQCNTMLGNEDVYIGPKDIKKTDKFCNSDDTKDEEKKTYTKTYNVLNVTDSNDENYVYLTLRQYQCEEVVTVKVEKKLNTKIAAKNNYEFTFEKVGNKKVDNESIESIFKNAKLTKIKKTSKKGIEQIQEEIE